jgi:hypothetical protein
VKRGNTWWGIRDEDHSANIPVAAEGDQRRLSAVSLTASAMSVPTASFPLVIGIGTAFVAYGRTNVAPISSR